MPHKDPEARRAYFAAYDRKNRARKRSWEREQYQTNSEFRARKRAAAKLRLTENPELRARQNARQRASYAAADPTEREHKRLSSEVSRAKKHNALGHVSAGIRSTLRTEQGNKCAFCYRALGDGIVHLDHIVPLARGGLLDDSNLQVLCPQCNRRKADKDPIQFARENGRLL